MSSKQKVLHGLSWSLISRVGVQAFQFLFGVALARVLSPAEFGVFGMLIAFTGFAQVLAEGGLNAALIYKQDASEVDQSTAFWLQIIAGLILALVFFFAAPFIADFYETPILTPLTQLVSWVFLIQAFGQTHYANFSKQFRFKALAVASITGMFVSGTVAIVLALEGYGVWALAWQAIAGALTNSGLYWLQSRWRPRFVFSWHSAGELWRYSIYLLGHMSLNYWLRNGDKLVIGKVLGASELGLYSRAYTLMLLPLNNLGTVIGQVMFPALSAMQNDIPRFARAYVKSTQMIALLAFPVMFGLAVLSGPFILFVYGPKWAEAVPILQILSLVGLFQSIVFPVGWVFTSLGKTKSQFLLSILFTFLFVAVIAAGIQYGLLGVSYAYAAWTAIVGLINLYVVGKYLGLSLLALLGAVARIFLMSAIMAVAVFLLDVELLAPFSNLVRLLAGTLVGGGIYLGLCLILRDPTFREALDLALGAIRKRRGQAAA
jgi:O-antigen/teichoic acid export membrane protein